MRRIPVGDFIVSDKMRAYVNDVLDSGQISYGKYSRQFEQEFAALHGCEYGVLSNSGTDALRTSLQALKELHGWQDGDEVLAPALTFVATINVILHNRLTPVLVDIEPGYYGIDPELIERAITPKTRAIMPVHLFGHPCNIPVVMDIARKHNLRVIEDSCEIAFASIMSGAEEYKSVSAWGDVGCHSFYMAHIVTTGVGGMSLTNNRDYAMKIRSISNHGLTYKELSREGDDYDPSLLSRFFRFDTIGHSARITELEAVLGLAQLEVYKHNVQKRLANYFYYGRSLKDLEIRGYIKLPKIHRDYDATPMMYPVATLTEPKHRLMKYLDQQGIGVRDTVPLTNQPAYKDLFRENDYPQARFMNEHGLYWGVHPGLTQEDREYVVETVYDYFILHYGDPARKRDPAACVQ
jgi:perosamine synthetase